MSNAVAVFASLNIAINYYNLLRFLTF